MGYWLFMWVLPATSLMIGVVCLAAFVRQNREWSQPLIVPTCIGLALAWGSRGNYKRALRRSFRVINTLANDEPMFCEFDETSVRFVVSGGTEVAYPWTAFTAYREDERVVVLFIGEAAFHTIPKRAMDEAGWTKVRQFANHLVKNEGRIE